VDPHLPANMNTSTNDKGIDSLLLHLHLHVVYNGPRLITQNTPIEILTYVTNTKGARPLR